jgi:hypothetical protein
MLNSKNLAILMCAVIWTPLAARAEESSSELPRALPGAHAHNDYYHRRPLWDALERGFVSIEADVFLVEGRLLVAHDRQELHSERTLSALYLDPLRKHLKAHGGRVFDGGEQLTLLVDFKSPGQEAYKALDELLEQYDDLTSAAKKRAGAVYAPVRVIVTGDRPIDVLRKDDDRRAVLDGRLVELELGLPAELMPLVSESWKDHFQWRGEGPMPAAERGRLIELTKRVHREERKLRFWATPDDQVVWKELQAAGVDWIGADDLEALETFLRRRQD